MFDNYYFSGYAVMEFDDEPENLDAIDFLHLSLDDEDEAQAIGSHGNNIKSKRASNQSESNFVLLGRDIFAETESYSGASLQANQDNYVGLERRENEQRQGHDPRTMIRFIDDEHISERRMLDSRRAIDFSVPEFI